MSCTKDNRTGVRGVYCSQRTRKSFLFGVLILDTVGLPELLGLCDLFSKTKAPSF